VELGENVDMSCYIFNSSDDWMKFNTLIGAQPGLMEAVGHLANEACCFGDLSAEASASLQAWNDLPTFKVHETAVACGFIAVPAMTHSTYSIFFDWECKDADAMVAACQSLMPVFQKGCATFAFTKSGPNSVYGAMVCDTDTDWYMLDKEMGAYPELAGVIATNFKNCTSAIAGPKSMATKAALAKWNMPGHTMIQDAKSVGAFGSDGAMGFLNIFQYESAAAMEASFALSPTFNWPEIFGKASGATTYFNCKLSDTSLAHVCMFPNVASWNAINALFVGTAEVQQVWAGCTSCVCHPYGNLTQSFLADLQGWCAVPCFSIAPPMINCSLGADSGCWFINQWKSKGSATDMIDMMVASEDTVKAMEVNSYNTKTTAATWPVGEKETVQLSCFSDEAAWLQSNAALKEMPLLAGMIGSTESVDVTCVGFDSEAAVAALDEWRKAPMFNISVADRVGY